MRGPIGFNDIIYDDHVVLLRNLASKVVASLQLYLSEEDDLVNGTLEPRKALQVNGFRCIGDLET